MGVGPAASEAPDDRCGNPVAERTRTPQSFRMASIAIRDVPEETLAERSARAAAAGQSIEEYIRALLVEHAEQPDVATLMAAVRERKQRSPSSLTTELILEYRDADRR